MNQSRFRPVKHLKMTVRTSVLWKMNIHMAKKWPEMVIQRSYIKGHSFPYSLYKGFWYFSNTFFNASEFYINPFLPWRNMPKDNLCNVRFVEKQSIQIIWKFMSGAILVKNQFNANYVIIDVKLKTNSKFIWQSIKQRKMR